MPKDLADLKVCIFDVFGTVVDWRGSLIEDLPRLGAKHGMDTDWTSFADDWRGLYQPQMARVRKGELPWTRIDDRQLPLYLHVANVQDAQCCQG